MMQEWHQAEYQRRMAPQVQIALDRLKLKYEKNSPFADFGVGRHAATPVLRELAKENNLPNGEPSPWLFEWIETLEEMPWMSHPLPKPLEEEESLRGAFLLADSVIKKHVVQEKVLPTEGWSHFVQRVFEEEWVKKVGSMAGAANKKGDQTVTVWTLGEFVAFVEKVVARLNAIGYRLRTPAETRLRTLLERASRGESLHEEGAW